MKTNITKIFLFLFCVLSVNANAQYYELENRETVIDDIAVQNIFQNVLVKDKELIYKNNISKVMVTNDTGKVIYEIFYNSEGTIDSICLSYKDRPESIKYFYIDGKVSKKVFHYLNQEQFTENNSNNFIPFYGEIENFYRSSGKLYSISSDTYTNSPAARLRFYFTYDSLGKIVKSGVKNAAADKPEMVYDYYLYNKNGTLKSITERNYTFDYGEYPVLNLSKIYKMKYEKFFISNERISKVLTIDQRTEDTLSTKLYYYKVNGLIDYIEITDKQTGNKSVQTYIYIYR